MNALTCEDMAAARADLTPEYLAGMCGMACYDPDDDGGDGETDECPTPIVVVTPWRPDGDGASGEFDDDRRRAEWDAGFAAGRAGVRRGEGRRVLTTDYGDGYDAGASALARVEAAALADYGGWLTCAEWDALDTLTRFFGLVSFDGRNAVVANMSAHHLRWWLDRIGLGHLPHTERVFGGGLVVAVRGAA